MSPARSRTRRSTTARDEASMRESLESALDHAQRAAAEGVAGARDLLDVASIGVLGAPAHTHRSLGELAKLLEQLERTLNGEAPSFRNAAINTVLAAVDREVERWELRSKDDPDARAVLRVFLGMREVLWELGVRPETRTRNRSASHGRNEAGTNRAKSESARTRSTRRARVQRIPIQR